MRNIDEQGRWSATVSRPLYVCPEMDIVQLEYYFDVIDPGYGKAIQVELSADRYSPFVFDVPTDGLYLGNHLLNVRARDSKDRWTVLSIEPFSVVEKGTGVRTLVSDFAFAIAAEGGRCRMTSLGDNSRHGCRVEVADVSGQLLATAEWPSTTPQLSRSLPPARELS